MKLISGVNTGTYVRIHRGAVYTLVRDGDYSNILAVLELNPTSNPSDLVHIDQRRQSVGAVNVLGRSNSPPKGFKPMKLEEESYRRRRFRQELPLLKV